MVWFYPSDYLGVGLPYGAATAARIAGSMVTTDSLYGLRVPFNGVTRLAERLVRAAEVTSNHEYKSPVRAKSGDEDFAGMVVGENVVGHGVAGHRTQGRLRPGSGNLFVE